MSEIKFIDSFAGIDGLRTLFEKLGGKFVFFCYLQWNLNIFVCDCDRGQLDKSRTGIDLDFVFGRFNNLNGFYCYIFG